MLQLAAQKHTAKTPGTLPRKAQIHSVQLPKTINTLNAPHFIASLEQAAQQYPALILVRIERSTGGDLQMANRIGNKIRAMQVPVYAYVTEEVFGVANLVALSCQRMYMSEKARIGDAVVRQSDGQLASFGYQKILYESLYNLCQMRGTPTTTVPALMGDLDEQDGRMVLLKKGMLSANEALRMGLCQGKINSIQELVEHQLGYKDYQHIYAASSFWDYFVYFFAPLLAGYAVALMMMCLYHFLKEPKAGYPLILFVIVLSGWMLFYYTQGTLTLVECWVGVGLVLLFVFIEIVWLPFFFFLGYIAISLLPIWHFFAANDNLHLHHFSYAYHLPMSAIFLYVGIDLLFFAVLFLFFHENLLIEGHLKRLFVWWEHSHQRGASPFSEHWRARHIQSLVGAVAKTATMLRPMGKIKVGEKKYYAIAPGYVEKGVFVGVTAVKDGHYLLLEVIPLDVDMDSYK